MQKCSSWFCHKPVHRWLLGTARQHCRAMQIDSNANAWYTSTPASIIIAQKSGYGAACGLMKLAPVEGELYWNTAMDRGFKTIMCSQHFVTAGQTGGRDACTCRSDPVRPYSRQRIAETLASKHLVGSLENKKIVLGNLALAASRHVLNANNLASCPRRTGWLCTMPACGISLNVVPWLQGQITSMSGYAKNSRI